MYLTFDTGLEDGLGGGGGAEEGWHSSSSSSSAHQLTQMINPNNFSIRVLCFCDFEHASRDTFGLQLLVLPLPDSLFPGES